MKRLLSIILVMIMLLSSSVNMTANAGEEESIGGEEIATAGEVENITEEIATAEKTEEDIIDTETAETPSTVTEKGMQFRIENLQDVKSIRYAYGEYETEKDIKYGEDSVSHSAKTLRTRGDFCILQFPKPGLVSIVITYNDGTRDFHKYEVIKSLPTVTRDGGNSITFENLNDLKVLRYVKGEYESSYDIKRASGSVAVSGKTLNSDTYTATLERETYTFCVQYNDESYNYYVTGICGDNLTWVYDMQTCTLTISGEGEMENYDYQNYPWSQYSDVTEKLIVNERVTTIGEYGFTDFKNLVDINLPSTLERINYRAFTYCTSVISVDLPKNIRTIAAEVFMGCKLLKNAKLNDNLEVLGASAFKNCTSLININIPDSLNEVGFTILKGTPIINDENNWIQGGFYWDNCLIYADEKDSNNHFFVQNGTRKILGYALHDLDLYSITIPESVKSIGKLAIHYYEHDIVNGIIQYPVINCYKDSFAYRYAIENNYLYQLINQ